jgi:hypothetical protein
MLLKKQPQPVLALKPMAEKELQQPVSGGEAFFPRTLRKGTYF